MRRSVCPETIVIFLLRGYAYWVTALEPKR